MNELVGVDVGKKSSIDHKWVVWEVRPLIFLAIRVIHKVKDMKPWVYITSHS
jgi:hypothetical protein